MIRNVSCTTGLSDWEPVLNEWFRVLDDYATTQTEDVAYWYNERATLSTVAGAIWRSKGVVLEEYRTTRVGLSHVPSWGRTDLWCKLAEHEYTVEAKQALKLSYPATHTSLQKWSELQLKSAAEDCHTDAYGAVKRLAMAFLIPSIKNNPNETEINGWADASANIKSDLKAIYLQFPAAYSRISNRHFPGVILLANLVPEMKEPTDE